MKHDSPIPLHSLLCCAASTSSRHRSCRLLRRPHAIPPLKMPRAMLLSMLDCSAESERAEGRATNTSLAPLAAPEAAPYARGIAGAELRAEEKGNLK